MYINKPMFYFFKFFIFLGINFNGAFGVIFLTGLGIDVAEGQKTPSMIYGITVFFLIFWVLFLFLNHYYRKVKIYDSFFSTDADGIVYPNIVATALGIEEKKVIRDIRILLKMNYFRNCQFVEREGKVRIILTNREVAIANRLRYKIVHCRNCGGENKVREGFVYGCQYCAGRIE